MDATTGSPGQPALLREASALAATMGELGRRLQAADRRLGAHHGVSPSQLQALDTLYRSGPHTVNELAAALHLDKSTASRLAEVLVGKGLVRKRAPGTDARVVVLQLTESGLRLARRISDEGRRTWGAVLAILWEENEVPAAELEGLPTLLSRLGRVQEEVTGDRGPSPGSPPPQNLLR